MAISSLAVSSIFVMRHSLRLLDTVSPLMAGGDIQAPSSLSMSSTPFPDRQTCRRGEENSQCVDCGSSRSALRGSVMRIHEPPSASSSAAVRLAAKIVFRRCLGLLPHAQASTIDNLIHGNDEQQQQYSSRREDRIISRHEQDEDCARVRDMSIASCLFAR